MKDSVMKGRRRARKGSISFNPNHNFIAEATENFLQQGGKINRLEADKNSFENSWIIGDVSSDVDEFLLGQ